ncbi:pacifastin-like protease inhibitor cvp4 [Diachasmimorpha longicaudata]|uniref:pacifastin-like protease inhibitor cvp4 n=1 Tax=Diachasmimorpha longicaudata TaxID=58733 RepID=UPI0030B90CA3
MILNQKYRFIFLLTIITVIAVASGQSGDYNEDQYEPSVPDNYPCTGTNFMWYCQYCQCRDGVVGGCTRNICPTGIWRSNGTLIHENSILNAFILAKMLSKPIP